MSSIAASPSMPQSRPVVGFYTDELGRVRPITSPAGRVRANLVRKAEQILGYSIPADKRGSVSKVLAHLKRKVMGRQGKGGKRDFLKEEKSRLEFEKWMEEHPEEVKRAILESGVFSAEREVEVGGEWDIERLERVLEGEAMKAWERGARIEVWKGKRKSKGKLRWVYRTEGSITSYEVFGNRIRVRVSFPSPIRDEEEALRSRIGYAVDYLGAKRGCIRRAR